MPKKYGRKEKDLVVSHVVNLMLTGKLRSGDRIDRNEIAQQLGLSRVPIQEAMVQLEHDGIISTQYHRGAYVERFDASVVREHHELFGLLTGTASARAAADPDRKVVDRLDLLSRTMATSRGSRAFQSAAWQYRQTINDAYAGPRLRAAIRASYTLVPRKFWMTDLSNHSGILQAYQSETAAIDRSDPEAARAACILGSETMCQMMLTELVRRGVLSPTGAAAPAF